MTSLAGHQGGLLRGVLVILMTTNSIVSAQLAPEIGFMHPAGARVGGTVDVVLGGFDWTPDMQVFAHDPRVKIELLGGVSGVLVPEPPYWFGAKGRGPAWPLSREFTARLTVPADVAPGIIRWQVANANGVSPSGSIHISGDTDVVDVIDRTSPQELPALPVTVSGQIRKIEEVDRYQFSVPKPGPVTVELIARRLGSPLHGMLKVMDPSGRVVVDIADTEGRDGTATFVAEANVPYTAHLHDLDFAGDRSYVYRLAFRAGPQVTATYPLAGCRGEARSVEFVGYGLATGSTKLETVARDVTFTPQGDGTTMAYVVETPHGPSQSVVLMVSDQTELVEPAAAQEMVLPSVPIAVTGALETRFGSDSYTVALKKGETWKIGAAPGSLGARLDLELSILDAEGKSLMMNDDAAGSINPALLFAVPADGTYRLVVTDRSGKSGSRQAAYRLEIAAPKEDFSLTVPPQFTVTLGTQAKLSVKVAREGGFKGPITLALTGLPAGVTVPAELTLPGDKPELVIDVTSAPDSAALAGLATLTATTTLNGQPVTRTVGTILVAAIMKPRIKITPEGLDDVRKVHRGSTYLAPVFVDRLEGFTGEVVLEMTSKQQRHRQGLASGEFTVAPDMRRVEYPIFVPEWMETTKTSRMILNGAVKVADPKGNVRTLLQRQELRLGILPEGALMKLGYAGAELKVAPGGELRIPLTLSRVIEFREAARIEFQPTARQNGLITVEPVDQPIDRTEAVVIVRFANEARLNGEQLLKFRASSLKDGKWPVISEETIRVEVGP